MSLVTKVAPDFTAQAVMPDGTIGNFTLSEHRGKYVVLFFYPLDFTFVCPTEIVAFDKAADQFDALNTVLVSASVDSVYSHWAWRNTPRDHGGVGSIHFPMVSDLDKMIARRYGVLSSESVALRGLFLIDKEGVVRHEVVNDLPLGRSVEEALRMVEALRFYEENGEVCPANWHHGEKGMPATHEGVSAYLARE